jgi:ribosomal protein S18 acetylase RimI-like enzyme
MIIDDLPSVYYLGVKVFTKDQYLFLYRTWETYEVTGLFYSDQELCIVAEHLGKVIGFAMGSIIVKPRSSWTYGYLVWTGILPDYQGKRVAKRLYYEIERRVKALGARMMIIDTEGTNHRAVRFFEKMGFLKGSTHLWMTKFLRPPSTLTRSKTLHSKLKPLLR